jgi:L-alanine-DL-glutamate epimerase-like enolase superfamily enzyme
MVSIFTLHLLAAIPNGGPHMEFSIEPPKAAAELYSPALEVNDGHVTMPDGPGWGVTINPAWLARADRQVSRLT